MHYLVTGHTGFKGSWLAVLLESMGHTVSGFALPELPGSAFQTAGLASLHKFDERGDVRDFDSLASFFRRVKPEVVIHLAAQPLVLEGYAKPRETFETNVTGTLNILEAAKQTSSIQAVVIVTTDKVYKDLGTGSYSEESELGGYDPYSASKAMADLLAQSYGNLELPFRLGVARAGNVIGLGDVSENRLIPDIARAYLQGSPLQIRNLNAVRPWQHVLDCLQGYLSLVDYMLKTASTGKAEVFNFGPDPSGYQSVSQVVKLATLTLPGLEIQQVQSELKETNFLTLSSEKAQRSLAWKNAIGFEESVKWSLEDLHSPLSLLKMRDQVQRLSLA